VVLVRHDPARREELLAATAVDEAARRARKGLTIVQK